MVDDLRRKGMTDERVLKAMLEVPRHLFLDLAFDARAYDDDSIPIGCDQTISHPSTVAMQSHLLNLEPGLKVLEIGTGSGYQTAVLCALKARVFSVERQQPLFVRTKKLLSELRYTAKCFLGDGYQGLTEVDYSPYDRVLITCGAPFVPPALMASLRTGGIMVIPLGEKQQEMLRITKHGPTEAEWEVERFGNFKFVPMLGGRQFKS